MLYILIMILIVLIPVSILFVRYHQQKYRKKELTKISDMLEQVLNKEAVFADQPFDDTLFAKISQQILRLQNMTEGYHRSIEKDRDAIKQLIMEIAHQLRTPLTNMENYLDFLKDEEDTQARQKYWDAVSISEKKVRFLTESFIKMSRLENRIIQIDKSDTDLKDTLLTQWDMFRAKAKEKCLTIGTELPDMLVMPHDANWLGEAVGNLLDNAIKYSYEDGRIILGADQNEMSVHIWIRDYGCGIEGEDEAKLFERFFRGRNAKKTEGFGIGLWLTREIVQMHHGTIRIKGENPGVLAEMYFMKG